MADLILNIILPVLVACSCMMAVMKAFISYQFYTSKNGELRVILIYLFVGNFLLFSERTVSFYYMGAHFVRTLWILPLISLPTTLFALYWTFRLAKFMAKK